MYRPETMGRTTEGGGWDDACDHCDACLYGCTGQRLWAELGKVVDEMMPMVTVMPAFMDVQAETMGRTKEGGGWDGACDHCDACLYRCTGQRLWTELGKVAKVVFLKPNPVLVSDLIACLFIFFGLLFLFFFIILCYMMLRYGIVYCNILYYIMLYYVLDFGFFCISLYLYLFIHILFVSVFFFSLLLQDLIPVRLQLIFTVIFFPSSRILARENSNESTSCGLSGRWTWPRRTWSSLTPR